MNKWLVRFGWMVAGIAALYAVSALAGAALGGPLDPPGSPAPTMKTLEEIPGTWSRMLGASGSDACDTARFTCVLGNQAVRDNETGLVWERTPSTTPVDWSTAVRTCGDGVTGGRGGWRVPTDAEVRSLLDPAGSGQPILPDGHPFVFAGTFGLVWTVSPVPNQADHVYSVDVDTLDRDPTVKTTLIHRWCVRGVQADAPEDLALAELPPAWYRTLDATGGCFSERFRCVLSNEAVLDRETGLVWQRNVSAETAWYWGAYQGCLAATTGNRRGWRLPKIEELMSLSIPGQTPSLPVGHPFTGANTEAYYWSATTAPYQFPENAYSVMFSTGYLSGARDKNTLQPYWCVRGGQGYDATYEGTP